MENWIKLYSLSSSFPLVFMLFVLFYFLGVKWIGKIRNLYITETLAGIIRTLANDKNNFMNSHSPCDVTCFWYQDCCHHMKEISLTYSNIFIGQQLWTAYMKLPYFVNIWVNSNRVSSVFLHHVVCILNDENVLNLESNCSSFLICAVLFEYLSTMRNQN